ncbi:retroviral-like aspartic protease family protein [bacterium]|nr:retroviral-like aspartic protease family protein [bacterium]MBU1614458.1 retroviral-like aspartic protease family protein [bacterium]
MPNITTFNIKAHYIYLPIFVVTDSHKHLEFDAILDTGAPMTEFSDKALQYAGFLDKVKNDVTIKSGLQTQKYSTVILPQTKICGHKIKNLKVFVSHFEKSWGIDALIGLDFFRDYRVTIDYSKGILITEPNQS